MIVWETNNKAPDPEDKERGLEEDMDSVEWIARGPLPRRSPCLKERGLAKEQGEEEQDNGLGGTKMKMDCADHFKSRSCKES